MRETQKKNTGKNCELDKRREIKNYACDVIFNILYPYDRHRRRSGTTTHENKQHICRLLESSNCSKKMKAKYDKHQDQKEITDFHHSTAEKKMQT